MVNGLITPIKRQKPEWIKKLYAVYKKYFSTFVCHYLQMYYSESVITWVGRLHTNLRRVVSSREGMRTELEKGSSIKSGMLYLKTKPKIVGGMGSFWSG